MTLLEKSACEVSNDPAYVELKRHIVDMTGLAYYLDKDVELASHVGRRLEAQHISDCGSYLETLRDHCSGAEELDELTTSLTNGETFFFRHQELFDALSQHVIPDMIQRNRHQRRLRVWSAGCANGAEPYSLSILLRREFGAELAGWDVTIVGTDVNRQFLAQGERGEFSEWSLRSMSADLQASCFHRSGNAWTINDAYRCGVLFRYHNLVQHPFPALINGLLAFDLILCRNVMIYFAPPIIERLVGQFHDCLVAGGWLAVGPAEPNVGLFRAFETVNVAGAVLYRQRPQPAVPDALRAAASPVGVLPARHPREAPKAAARAACRQTMDADEARREPATERLNPLLHFNDALSAEHRGRHGETERALRRAIYLDRDFVLAHYHLGLVLLRRRDVCGARRSFRNVLTLLEPRGDAEMFPDADGLTVGALRQLTGMQLEVLNCT